MNSNFEVKIASYGKYTYGQIIPESVIRANVSDPSELVATGVLAPTEKPVNCSIHMPEAAPVSDVTQEVIYERNKLLAENEDLSRRAKILTAKVAEMETLIVARDRALSEQISKIARLEQAVENFDTQCKALTEELEAKEADIASLNAELEVATNPEEPLPVGSNGMATNR